MGEFSCLSIHSSYLLRPSKVRLGPPEAHSNFTLSCWFPCYPMNLTGIWHNLAHPASKPFTWPITVPQLQIIFSSGPAAWKSSERGKGDVVSEIFVTLSLMERSRLLLFCHSDQKLPPKNTPFPPCPAPSGPLPPHLRLSRPWDLRVRRLSPSCILTI